MTEDDGYFGEEIAATYDAVTSGMHDQSVINAVIDVLAELAGDGRALEFGVGTGPYRSSARSTRCRRTRHRPVQGRWSPECGISQAEPRSV